MPPIKKILVGIDGSEGSYRAASYAAELAAHYGATVTLMFVALDSIYTDRFISKPTYVPNEDILAGEMFKRAGLKRSKNGYDLVVVGARGVSGIQEFLLGSVSSRIVEHSEVPVMVVP
jgi:nucleotide-binding universal stress UspA family protein